MKVRVRDEERHDDDIRGRGTRETEVKRLRKSMIGRLIQRRREEG
jgi:hypothetical protein